MLTSAVAISNIMKSYLSKLSKINELLEVKIPVDPLYELAAVTKAAQKKGDEALLFSRINGTDFPVVTNLYGSRRRLCELVGADDENFCPAWNRLLSKIGEKSAE